MSGSNLSDPTLSPAAPTPDSTAWSDQPLGLTVHSLPQPGDVASAQRTLRGRWKMLAVLLVCAAPVVASYFTYYVIRPEGRRNHGELIDPQRPLPDVVVQALDGTPGNLQTLRGQWLLVSVAGGACDSACEQHLYLQRQILTGLGKDRDRIDWVWLVDDQAEVPQALRPALQEALVRRVPAQALAQWLAPEAGHALAEHLYVVDPQGHWMMRFPAGVDKASAPKVKRDLERLLRASASWDTAGRPQAQASGTPAAASAPKAAP